MTHRVLLVEDEFLVALHVEGALEDLCCEVVGPFGRVEEALTALESDPRISFAVLDINLAGEMSWPLARALRLRCIPFAFVSGYVEAHELLPPDLVGAPLLPKPLQEDDLARALGMIGKSDSAPG